MSQQLIITSLSLISAILVLWIARLEIVFNKNKTLKLNKSLVDKNSKLEKELNSLQTKQTNTEKTLEEIENKINLRLIKNEVVRFNPFKGQGIGGNQSFSTPFVDKDGNGFLITSIYSRENTRISSKLLTAWKCEAELMEEEIEAIEKTKKNV